MAELPPITTLSSNRGRPRPQQPLPTHGSEKVQRDLQIIWPEYSEIRPPKAHEIHLWAIRLDSAHDPERRSAGVPARGFEGHPRPSLTYDALFDEAPLQNLLSPDEKERAARYHFDLHRQRFIRCRSALRVLLAAYLNILPRELPFRYGPNGKPALADPAPDSLHFNVAHCDDLALIAIAHFSEIGVDLENIRWLDDFDELVNRFFSEREAQCFKRLDSDLKPAAFFNLWTRKEALLKATGEGICNSLNRVEVTFLPAEPAQLLALPQDANASEWILRELVPATGYVGALAVKTTNIHVICREFVPKGQLNFAFGSKESPNLADVPKKHPKIAQRFNVGFHPQKAGPEGTADHVTQ